MQNWLACLLYLAASRIRQLEEAGVIEGYTARLNHNAMGLGICVMVSVKLSLQAPEGHEQFLKAISQHKEITDVSSSPVRVAIFCAYGGKTLLLWRFSITGLPCVVETATTLVLKHLLGSAVSV
ncbi:hypothetical protein OGM23_10075 [Dickeya fangzhongdai]|uniref:Lrp/AsnC family transcriptional regulator n=1 Tax=Dickeya fangzhongdai TaxID=1778540 RepID=UPI002B287CB7|nr:hypothetical protein OGM23_10075 [Dickeya fangzhongdai]